MLVINIINDKKKYLNSFLKTTGEVQWIGNGKTKIIRNNSTGSKIRIN